MSVSTSSNESRDDAVRVVRLEAENAALREQLAQTTGSLDRLRRAYTTALEQLQLLRRQLFVSKAERVDHSADQLAFDALLANVQQLERAIDAAEAKAPQDDDASRDDDKKMDRKKKPTGRRDLSETSLPVERIEVLDPELEGRAERIGFQESSRLGYERGGPRRIVVAVAVYKEPAKQGETAPTIVTTTPPKELFRRAFLAPSMIAHVLSAKYMMGTPFYRLEQQFALSGISLDRGTMCRYAEDAGATLGAIVEAARADAFAHAFCLSTDATGVSIQPGPLAERNRQACRKGHFFVVLADRDHVFFEYQPRHTSAAVSEMFKGYSGYIQADAHAVYDALFRGDAGAGPPPTEVGCWSHCRRNFWEAAVCKHPLGLEGLRRIDAIFAADRKLADLAPAQRAAQRQVHMRPLLDVFFAWVDQQLALPRERGLVATALGYARNQREPLSRFLEDGRLRLDNNASERALRAVAVGRKNWLFFGSDDHASAAANLFSLIASCKLHKLDPEQYLAEVIRVMPYWPRERYLELAPREWARTRERLEQRALANEYGAIEIPPPAEEQRTSG